MRFPVINVRRQIINQNGGFAFTVVYLFLPNDNIDDNCRIQFAL